ncbi:MAG: tRNA (pseudouridine(54)-N(1))-methyltransferase TrmY [Thermoplasmata archaeon]|nr:tRNA (pseudouridine(54)-N(1))-methyltransferase TrmY [Thermoplasmata archaeon]
MRRFLLLAHRVPVDGAFTLNDLAGGGGRMDEIARCVSTAFTISNDLRRDTELTVLFGSEPPPRSRRIDIYGARLRLLNPDERSTAALLKNALIRSHNVPGIVESSPGMVVGPSQPLEDLARFASQPGCWWLVEGGAPLASLAPTSDVAAVLSDPTDPTPPEREILERSGAVSIRVGPRSLRSSQVLDVVQNVLDGASEAVPVDRTPR